MTSIRAWLRRHPLPARIRADGREIAIPQSPSRWADLAQTLDTLGASQIEALGPDGQVLRAISLDSPEAPDPEVAAEDRRERLESQRVREAVEVARVVAGACEQAVRLHAETYATVLQRYEGLLQLMVQRLTSAERGYQTALVAAAQAQASAILSAAEAQAQTDGATDPVTQLAAAALPALLSGGSGPREEKK